jgi:hypothetical protein
MSQSKTIQTQKLNVLDYFKIIIKIFEIIEIWDMWQQIICSHSSPKKSHPSPKQQYIYG